MADLGSLLKGKTLKKTETKDKSGPKLRNDPDQQQIQKDVNDINFEKWYEQIKDFTFETAFFPITPEIASALRNQYRIWKFELDGFINIEDKGKEEIITQLTPEETDIIAKLTVDLQPVIDRVGGETKGVFVKTSCRSPKDAPAHHPDIITLYQKICQENDYKSENDRLIGLLQAGIDMCRVEKAEEVLRLFSMSNRVYVDLGAALDSSVFDFSLVVRKWVGVKCDMEFRSWVNKGQLNALSQYNCNVFFPKVARNEEAIKAKIEEFFYQQLKPRLGDKYAKYVVDYAVSDDLSKVYVIELNPFYNADAALFSTDLDILENGPYTFKIVKKDRPGSSTFLPKEWLKIFHTLK